MKFQIWIAPIFLLFPAFLYGQDVDKKQFDESSMNNALFKAVKKHIMKIHNGDSITQSCVIQNIIMSRNHEYIVDHSSSDISLLHNQIWLGRPNNDLPDSIRTMIIDELTRNYPNSDFLKRNWIDQIKQYGCFSYTEIIASIIMYDSNGKYNYSQIAELIVKGWNDSPPHAAYLNANYCNAVIAGVTSYYDSKSRSIIVSFIFVN